MDSSDIYYSDNSQLIESNSTEWIENTVLIDNQNVTWDENGAEITVDYSESSANINQTISENDDYLTAETEDSNETSQYFSILEPNCEETENDFSTSDGNAKCVLNVAVEKEEAILPDIAKYVENKEHEAEIHLDDKVPDDQVILYRMEGSDELYALQIADDGNGNLQKYKYKVRQTADGQLEAIPGSIEIQKAELEDEEILQEDNLIRDANSPFEQKPIPESILNPGPSSATEQQTCEFVNATEENPELENNFYITNSVHSFDNAEFLLQNSYEEPDEEYQTVEGIHITGDSEPNTQNEHFETEFVKTSGIYPHEDNSESEYEVEELEEAFQDETINETYEEQISNNDISQVLQHKSNIGNVSSPEPEKELKNHLSDSRNVTIYKDEKNLSYLVVKGKEKENVSMIRSSKFNTSNLRSILKSNCPITKSRNIFQKSSQSEKQNSLPSIISSREPSSKISKEPKPANPVVLKSARQPRKQTITPVERAGSEIIVQPLIYSVDGDNNDNSVLTPISVKRKRLVEVHEVSDESDPEFTLKPTKKKKIKRINKYTKRGRPRGSVEITILDSDEELASEGSVIEVLTDEEDSGEESDTNKQKQIENNNKNEKSKIENSKENDKLKNKTVEKSDDLNKVENESLESSEESEEEPEKQESEPTRAVKKSLGNSRKNKCPFCPKTFPRLITLKRHMNIHSARRTLRSRSNVLSSNTESQTEINNKAESTQEIRQPTTKVSNVNEKARSYNCSKCKLKFLLESQYKRHQTVHITKQSNGSPRKMINKKMSPKKNIDKQKFIGRKHLRSYSKTDNDQPQKLSQTKIPIETKPTSKDSFKCEYCGQSFTQRALFFIHRNSHKTFPCPNCKTTFTAKLLLDDHLRTSCVRYNRQSTVKMAPKKGTFKCENCQQIFVTQRSLQIHISVTHRRKTFKIIDKPVSDISKKELILKKKSAHGGVPMSLKMQKAFDKMKLKT